MFWSGKRRRRCSCHCRCRYRRAMRRWLLLRFLLVAVQVYEFAVATHIRAIPRPGHLMVTLKFFTVHEFHPTESADVVLGHGQLYFLLAQVVNVDLPPFPPVFAEVGIIWRGCPLDQNVSDDLEPAKLEKVLPRVLVAKHPVVVPFLVQ